MRPDVALISPYPRLGSRHDGYSGVASYTANLAHALAGHGLRVTVVAPAEPGEPDAGQDGAVHVVRPFSRGGALAVPSALEAAAGTGAPVVHLQHELFLYSGAAGLPATMAALARGRGPTRSVVTMHQVVRPEALTADYARMHRIRVPAWAARSAIRAVQQAIPRLADAVIVHEAAFRDAVPEALVVPHGTEMVPPRTEPVAQLRKRLDLRDDALVALCFGFLAPYKGLETALEAAEAAGSKVQVVVAGGPHPRLAAQGDDYADRLQARWGHAARFTGYVPDGQVTDLFRAADVALLCYPEPHASSGPLALALAHGTPVLLSERLAATVAAREVLAVPPDPMAWAARLSALADDDAALDATRAATAALADGRAWPAVAARHIELYEEVALGVRPAASAVDAA